MGRCALLTYAPSDQGCPGFGLAALGRRLGRPSAFSHAPAAPPLRDLAGARRLLPAVPPLRRQLQLHRLILPVTAPSHKDSQRCAGISLSGQRDRRGRQASAHPPGSRSCSHGDHTGACSDGAVAAAAGEPPGVSRGRPRPGRAAPQPGGTASRCGHRRACSPSGASGGSGRGCRARRNKMLLPAARSARATASARIEPLTPCAPRRRAADGGGRRHAGCRRHRAVGRAAAPHGRAPPPRALHHGCVHAPLVTPPGLRFAALQLPCPAAPLGGQYHKYPMVSVRRPAAGARGKAGGAVFAAGRRQQARRGAALDRRWRGRGAATLNETQPRAAGDGAPGVQLQPGVAAPSRLQSALDGLLTADAIYYCKFAAPRCCGRSWMRPRLRWRSAARS